MKIEHGETYITFGEDDDVAKEHLGRWKLVGGGERKTCGLFNPPPAMTRACKCAGDTCLGDGGHYARA